jgi:protein SCO1/2
MDWRCSTCDGVGARRASGRPQAAWLLPPLLLLALPLATPVAASSSTGLLSTLPAAWLDDEGRPFDLRTLQGRRVVLTMAYATCHRVCPVTMRRLQQIQRELDERGGRAEFVVIGYDPEHDDAVAWHQYRAQRHLTRGNWHFLTGTRAAVEQTARRLGFGFWLYEQHVMHDLRIVWFDQHGALVAGGEGTGLETNGLGAGPGTQR